MKSKGSNRWIFLLLSKCSFLRWILDMCVGFTLGSMLRPSLILSSPLYGSWITSYSCLMKKMWSIPFLILPFLTSKPHLLPSLSGHLTLNKWMPPSSSYMRSKPRLGHIYNRSMLRSVTLFRSGMISFMICWPLKPNTFKILLLAFRLGGIGTYPMSILSSHFPSSLVLVSCFPPIRIYF